MGSGEAIPLHRVCGMHWAKKPFSTNSAKTTMILANE
jgi:hypothetical protein